MIETLLPASALAFPNIDPVIFQIGPLAVHWYGLGYVVGIMFAWWYGKSFCAVIASGHTTSRQWHRKLSMIS